VRVKLSFAQLFPWVPLSGWAVTFMTAVKVVAAAGGCAAALAAAAPPVRPSPASARAASAILIGVFS
jgi:hypothetical protein